MRCAIAACLLALTATGLAFPTTAIAADNVVAAAAPAEARHAQRDRQLLLLCAFAGLLLLGLGVGLARMSSQLRSARFALAAQKTSGYRNAALDAIPDLVWQKDLHGHYVDCNLAFAQFFGREPGEIIGASDTELIGNALAVTWRQSEQAAISNARMMETEQWITAAGTQRSLLLAIKRTPLYDGDGTLAGILSIGRDISEKRRVDNELRQRDLYQRALLDNFPYLAWMKDTEGRFLAANRRLLDLVGRPHGSSIRGMTDSDFWPEDVAKTYRANDLAVMRNRQQQDLEERVLVDGELRWFESVKAPILDDDGKLLGTVGFARDISERRTMLQRLADSEQRFRSLFEYTSSVMLLIDPDTGHIIDANPAAVAFYGYPADALLQKTINDLNTLSEEELAAARRRAHERQQNLFHFRHRLASGEVRDVDVYSTPIQGDERKLLFSIVHDVTEQRLAQQALRRERDLFSTGPVVVFTWDMAADWPVREVSSNLEQVLGYSVAEASTGDFLYAKLVHPDDIARLKAEVGEHLANGVDCFEQSYRLRHKSGAYRWCHDTTQIERDEAGEVIAVRGYVFDDTETKLLELSLAEQRRQLQQVIDATEVGTWQWNVTSDELLINERWAEIIGCRVADLGKLGFDTFADHLHPDDTALVKSRLQQHFDGEADSYECEVRLRHRAGHWVWVLSRGRVMDWSDDGKPGWMYGTHLEISDRKQAELELVEQRKRLQHVIEGTAVGTWEWNVQTGETRFNEQWAEMIGFRLDELEPISIGTWAAFAHPDDLDRSGELLQQHFRGETDFYECEARMRHRDGRWIWVLDRGRVFEWTDAGEPLWMYGTHQDITERKQAEIALRDSEQRLRTAGLVAYDLIYEWHVASGRLEWYGDIDHELGFQPGEISRHIDAWLALVHPDDREAMQKNVERHAELTQPIDDEYRIRHADGSYRYWQDKALPVLGDGGKPVKWVGVCADVTEERRNAEKLRLAGTVFDHAHEAIIITDADATIIDTNEAFTVITGYRRQEALGRNPKFLSSGRQDATFYERMWQGLKTKHHWQGEIWNRRKNGEVYAEMLAISAVTDNAGKVQNYVALFSDITKLKEHQYELEHIAYYDPLTKLPNRLLFADRLQQAMAQALRHDRVLAVIYLDLDGFKEVNDSFGHDVGDRVLIDVADRLRQALRQGDTLARLGGDEFAAVMTDLDDSVSCVGLLPRLLTAASQPYRIGEHSLEISASVGVTLFPQHDDVDPDQMLRQADQAMYQAKLGGKNRYHLFDAEQDRNIRGQVEIIDQVSRALGAGEFELHYQPKVNMRSGRVVGAEALIRWPLPYGGVRLPAEFLPFIENHPLAVKLDEWVLDQALNQLADWEKAGKDYSVSVNVSAYKLQQSDFIEQLRSQLERHPGLNPGNLIIEILETTALMDLARVSSVIHAGQKMGIKFALDDFGTGYSSLNYLKNLPARQLKIDRSFVRDMLDDRDDLAILEGIMGLAAAFDRTPIAEGVETVEHGEMLLLLGCELAQGFGIGRPMPIAQFSKWAEAWQPDRLWRDRPPVAREDLPLMFAMVEHRAWMKAVEDQLNGDKQKVLPLDERLCKFGQWLNSEARQRYAQSGALQPIIGMHRQIHQAAPRLLSLHRRGDWQSADLVLDELRGISRQMQRHLQALLRQHPS
jgi:diguanylate cyclase (GGDEF)-like protein/PAS domain S-box-containing protein